MSIELVKDEFRKNYCSYREQVEEMNCGHSLAQYIRPELAILAKLINAHAEYLQRHDSKFPDSWTPL